MAAPQTVAQFFEQEYAKGTIKRPADALAQLRADPRAFLLRYPIEIDESQQGGLIAAYIINGGKGKRPGSILKTSNMHDTEGFAIKTTGVPRETSPQTRAQFQAYYVPMHPSNQNTQWTQIGNAADIMLTCKLTGCSFVCRMNNNVFEAAHLQPQGESGLQLNTRLQGGGNQAWGRLKYDFDSRTVSIIGVRRGGQWKVYAQKLEKNTWNILSVHRVYPAE
jgi:hypothetical protein